MNDKPIPKYIAYHRDAFMGSNRVNRRLDWLQRHIYLRLCLEACFCETRPYLPTEDADLALLADVPDDVWTENKTPVLAMFTKSEQGYTHPRIVEELQKATDSYSRFSDLGKASAASRRAKSAAAPTLTDVPPLNARSAHVEQIRVDKMRLDQSRSDEQRTSTRINDNDASRTTPSHSAGSGFAATPTLTGLDRDDDAQKLVRGLHKLLSQRKDEVEIPASYEKFWLKDFRAALKTHTYAELQLVLAYSQLPRNQKYYKRAKPIVENFDSLFDQAMTIAGQEECRILWNAAMQGRLPAPKKEAGEAAEPKRAPDGVASAVGSALDTMARSAADPQAKGFDVSEIELEDL